MVAMTERRKCTVHLLDGRTLDIPLQPRLLSSELLDLVASHFNLREKEYFGLYFLDRSNCKCWLRPDRRAIDHEFPEKAVTLHFGVRYFVHSITVLKEIKTIELFFLQARRLIYKGEIECDSDKVFLLAAYVLQATHGDYVSDAIGLSDLKNVDVIPVETFQEHPSLSYCEVKILEQYKSLDGINRGEAIVNYLTIVERLPMYGVHYYDVKDKSNIPWKLGLSHRGIAQYDFQDKVIPRKLYCWNQMENLYYRERKFSVEVRDKPKASPSPLIIKTSSSGSSTRFNTLRKSFGQSVQVIAWYAETALHCREMWIMAVGLHQFYLDKKPVNKTYLTQRSLQDIARDLSKSSSSISSMLSSCSGFDDLSMSDSASYYYSLDGDSVTSSQVMSAEKDMVSALRTRKAFLEQQLTEKRELLNEICLREAELTGQVPSEIPESPTHPGQPMRRKIGTSFEYSDSIVNENGIAGASKYELMLRDFEIQNQITSAAKRLALDPAASRKVRKTRQLSYQKSLVKLKTMEQQLEYMKKELSKDSQEVLTNPIRRDENDSLGPIDTETSSVRSRDSSRSRTDSSVFAVPGITAKRLQQLSHRPSSTPPTIIAPLVTPRIELADINGYLNAPYIENLLRHRSGSVGQRSQRTRPVLATHMMEPHGSADQLNELSAPGISPDHERYLCGEFTNTGIYSAVSSRRPPGGGVSGISPSRSLNGVRAHAVCSPGTLRRLQMSTLSNSQPYLSMQRCANAQSQTSLSNSNLEHSGSWSALSPEETLV